MIPNCPPLSTAPPASASASLQQYDSKAQPPAPRGQKLNDAVGITFVVKETFTAWDVRSQAEFTIYRLQASVKRESGEVSTIEVLKRYSQFDELNETVRSLPRSPYIGRLSY